MLADGEISAGPLADFITVGVPIIPEVTRVGKELIFVIEIDLIEPAITPGDPIPSGVNNVLDGPDNVLDGTNEVVD